MAATQTWQPLERNALAARLAQDIPEGWSVNLGIGIPTLVGNYVPPEREVVFHSENGIVGMGPAPAPDKINRWLINASSQYVTLRPGASFVSHSDSFALVRGGHLDLCVLGAFQVAENGDLANWMIPGKVVKGMGGAMDLVGGVKKVVVVMEHSAKNEPKLLYRCTLPLTGAGVVDMVVTDLGVFTIDRKGGGMTLIALAPDVTLEEIKAKTEASFKTANTLKH
jgi:3-oxoacid CoA-transferase subunit B